jgi:superfamily II DNA or RNA helicase
MIRLLIENNQLMVQVEEGDLAPRHESQLVYWGFEFDATDNRFVAPPGDADLLAQKVVDYLTHSKCVYQMGSETQKVLERHQSIESVLADALVSGKKFKDGSLDEFEIKQFTAYLERDVPRKLKDHQVKAALHLMSVQNGANFSVPGSGKTTVVLVVFHKLRLAGEIDSLFVVGPPACFAPWRLEYKEVLGNSPSYEVLAGGRVDDRRTKYLVNQTSVCDLYLTTFQTLQRDWEHVRILFERQGVKFYLVVDEAHYIKQVDGAWANAVLSVAQHATRRAVLSGTPFPYSYSDAFNLFDVLWPESPPIPVSKRHRIEFLTQKKCLPEASKILDDSIGPLFYRVRKTELGLAPQEFHSPMRVKMNKYERLVYDSILDRIRKISKSDYFRNLELLMRLRRGRMMRLRQCLSYTKLLESAVSEYSENLLENNLSLADIIKRYDEHEMPAKLETLIPILRDLLDSGEKVVVWSNFVNTLKLICHKTENLGHGVRLIYGATPIQKVELRDEMTREEIIREFVDPNSGVDVLVANPAACAESISLHKTCSYAIYYDLSYNCAQYLQSLDRIHRVGGSEKKSSHYLFLQYEDTIDNDILTNVNLKAENMSHIIDQDYAVYSLDMFGEDEELDAYERIFGSQEYRI